MKPKSKQQPPRRDETTGKGNPELIGESGLPTPGLAEGDLETVEEALHRDEMVGPNERDDRSAADENV